jgi:hypothetical protein
MRWLIASIFIAWVLTMATAILMMPFSGDGSPGDDSFGLYRTLMIVYFLVGAAVSFRYLR